MIFLRKVSLLLVITMVFILTGCFGEAEEPLKGKSVSYTGTLKSLGEVVVDGKADHILEMDDGGIFYVYSSFIDLDKPKYKNSRVQINGKIMSITESGKEVIAIESLVPMTEEVIEQDTTDEAPKKYQNLVMGFKIENLIGFLIEENTNQISFTKDGGNMTVTRFDNTTGLTLDEWLDLDNITSRAPVFIGPDKLKAYLRMSDNSPIYFISRTNQYIYEVDLLYTNEELGNELKSILNSFRFVPLAEEDSPKEVVLDNRGEVEIEKVQEYFNKNIADLAPDYGGAEYMVLQLEFLNTPDEGLALKDQSNYVYVVYSNGDIRARLLASYKFSGSKVKDVAIEAVFEQGSVTDWELKDGEDLIKGQPLLVVKVGKSSSIIALEEGFRLFESGPFNFTVQYPSDWYVQGQSGKYLFNDAPLNGSYLISVEAQRKKIEDVIADIPFTFESLDLRKDRDSFVAHPVGSDLGVYIVVSRSDGDEAYVLWAVKSQEELLMQMAKSILES